MNELKLCPLCWGKAGLYTTAAMLCDPRFYVSCECCGIRTGEFELPEEAIEVWNRRAQAAREWISVNERLPEDDQTLYRYKDSLMEVVSVLACGYHYKDNNERSVGQVNRFIAYKTGISFLDSSHSGEWEWSMHFDRITHWMPLPEPPKEEHDG